MKWYEVVSGCDGYYTPSRFKTMKEAEEYIKKVDEEGEDLHISEGPYIVDTDDEYFYYKDGE